MAESQKHAICSRCTGTAVAMTKNSVKATINPKLYEEVYNTDDTRSHLFLVNAAAQRVVGQSCAAVLTREELQQLVHLVFKDSFSVLVQAGFKSQIQT